MDGLEGNPIKMDDLGVPVFSETPKWCHSMVNYILWDGFETL